MSPCKMDILLQKNIFVNGFFSSSIAVDFRHADYVTPLYLQTLALTSPTSGGRLIGIVR
jgi:hypothetical protein